jgi:probable H4MPT-linked C1 transfer pathway protein
MTPVVLGLDIGGANLKAATVDKRAASVPFALWKQPDRLPAALAELVQQFPDATELAVTMTGELCDCYETKRQGVSAILDAVEFACRGLPLRVWSTDGDFLSVEESRANHLKVAAANWHALATYAGRLVPAKRSLLIDTGSTTTDVIPIEDGLPINRGRTDVERLEKKELVYTGVRRTPICAVLGDLVAAEYFATTEDAYLLLGRLQEEPHSRDTADGKPATQEFAHARMSRMLCGDPSLISHEETHQLAECVFLAQIGIIEGAISVASEPANFGIVITSGSGEFLARAVVKSPWLEEAVHISLNDLFGTTVSACAPAYALAVLATERRP